MLHFIDIIEKQDLNGYFQYNIIMFNNFIKKGNQVTLVYENKNIQIYNKEKQKIISAGINLFEYNNLAELISFSKSKNTPIYINTFYEQHILLANKLKKKLGQAVTKNLNIFFDKSKLKKNDKQKLIIKLEQPIPKEIYSLKFPIFIKPTCGTSSIGTAKIDNINELKIHLNKIDKSINKLQKNGLNVTKLLIEDFIKGELYSINYFVNSKGKPYLSTTQKMWDNIGNDTHLICGEISQEVHKEVNKKDLLNFIKNTIKEKGIKNTFICHQFKKTPEGRLTTIEINGRIGGFNIELYKQSFDFNFLDLLLPKYKKDKIKGHGSSSFLRRYPKTEQTFQGYNTTFLKKINQLKSFHRGYVFPQKIGEKIGTPKNGYFYYGVLILFNNNRTQFVKDFQWIKDNYYDLFL